jgi:hypothetical protein
MMMMFDMWRVMGSHLFVFWMVVEKEMIFYLVEEI